MSRAVLYVLNTGDGLSTDERLVSAAEDFLGLAEGALAGTAVARTSYGKPYFVTLPVIVSVSHTGALWACLIADGELGSAGLDLQVPRDADFRAIAARFFTEQERRYVEETGKEGFYRLWTRKEALAKYLGLPLLEIAGKYNLTAFGALRDSLEEADDAAFYDISPDEPVFAAAVLPAHHQVNLCIRKPNAKR